MNSAKLFLCVVKEIERRADVEQFVLREQRKSAAAPSVEFVSSGAACSVGRNDINGHEGDSPHAFTL